MTQNNDSISTLKPSGPKDLDAGSLPVFSVVTCSYNQGKFLEETITSVLGQKYPRLQYIIIDGGSTDNSVEIIKKYARDLDYWVSEKDRGQSHAVNKGIARCTGEIFGWVNSDDMFTPGALSAVAKAWMQRPQSIICGHTDLFDSNGTFDVVRGQGLTLRNMVRFWEAENHSWCQPSTFVPVKALQEIGGLHENLQYAMDYVMLIELLAKGLQATYVDESLSRWRYHDMSKTVGFKEKQCLERVPALRRIQGLPVAVQEWEWDAAQARRMADLARRAWRNGNYGAAARLFTTAVATSPRGAAIEVCSRIARRANAPGKPKLSLES